MNTLQIQNKSLTVPGATLYRNGLSCDESMVQCDFDQLTKQILTVSDGVMFWIGDLINISEQRYGEGYLDASLKTGYAIPTLYNAKWVCSKIKISARAELSFGHHVKALSECDGNVNDAVQWLQKAVENKWGISEMSIKIRKANGSYQEKEAGGDSEVAATRGLYEIQRALSKIEASSKERKEFWSNELIDIVRFWLRITPKEVVERLTFES